MGHILRLLAVADLQTNVSEDPIKIGLVESSKCFLVSMNSFSNEVFLLWHLRTPVS